jgi:hypothetical protein
LPQEIELTIDVLLQLLCSRLNGLEGDDEFITPDDRLWGRPNEVVGRPITEQVGMALERNCYVNRCAFQHETTAPIRDEARRILGDVDLNFTRRHLLHSVFLDRYEARSELMNYLFN